jgi:predicted Zn-dependent protease
MCGTKPLSDAEIAADAARVSDFKARRGSPKAGTLITINTYVHVIHDGAEGRISERTIRDQMTVLNEAYAAYGFRFEMAPSVQGNPNPDYTDNAVWFNNQEEANFKAALKEGSGDDLNIYINSGGGFLGYAYYPTVVGTQYDTLDGVVLAYGTLPDALQPGISDIPGFVYNLGDTGTHEVGHYLGLAHTFEGHCSPYNDGVDDTPAERSPDFYCTVGRNSCKDGGGILALDPIHNFMDYSDDLCLFEFTGGQTERMKIQWALYRAGR